ncbi:hypothetical protein HA402_000624 [Bradysia odoriphaga]|nr:hypothetical protein HA402_000624 [Bradysia odoriphaga]
MGRQMAVVPVAMSLVASFISGISLLLYTYGTQYLFVISAFILAGLLTSYVYMPVFHGLRLESFSEITFLPVVIYVPALAFNQVSGINIYIVTPFVCAICIFYTFVGGIKAVVWTDCIQTFMMIGTMLVVKGTGNGKGHAYGFGNIWDTNWAGGRLVFPEQTSVLMKGVVLIASTALVFVVAKLGTVLQLQMSIAGVTAGPVFEVFTMGMLMPWVKRKVGSI